MDNITLKQLENFAERADERLDALELNATKSYTLTIPANGWTNDSGDAEFPYQCKLTVDGVTSASRADAVLDSGSVAIASDCGVCAASETADNTVIFTSRTAPTASLTGVLYITRVASILAT